MQYKLDYNLKTKAGDMQYPLHDGITKGLFQQVIRTYGHDPLPMIAEILNPKCLNIIIIKILLKQQILPRDNQNLNNVPESKGYSHLHHGQGKMLNHILISNPLLGIFSHTGIFNENLPDESLPYACPQLDQAPIVAEFK